MTELLVFFPAWKEVIPPHTQCLILQTESRHAGAWQLSQTWVPSFSLIAINLLLSLLPRSTVVLRGNFHPCHRQVPCYGPPTPKKDVWIRNSHLHRNLKVGPVAPPEIPLCCLWCSSALPAFWNWGFSLGLQDQTSWLNVSRAITS